MNPTLFPLRRRAPSPLSAGSKVPNGPSAHNFFSARALSLPSSQDEAPSPFTNLLASVAAACICLSAMDLHAWLPDLHPGPLRYLRPVAEGAPLLK
ncbi:hypothetical protein HaLaN_10515, partial [Haematococcus lacustris]